MLSAWQVIDIHCDFNSTDLRSTKKYLPCWCWTTLTPPPNTIPHIPDLRELTINRYSWLELQADHDSARRLRYTATHASARRTLSFTLLSRFSDDSRERSSRTPGHLDGGLVGLLWLGESENDTDLGLFPGENQRWSRCEVAVFASYQFTGYQSFRLFKTLHYIGQFES